MGILINTGFDVGSSSPIDSRTVKNTIGERDALISDGLVYENLKVYCKDTKTEYRWNGAAWEEVGTGGSSSGTDISMTDYYTKTEVDNDFLKKTDAASTYATKTELNEKANNIEGKEIDQTVIDTYGTEILKYPLGIWRLSSDVLANKFSDLPSKRSGRIEITSINTDTNRNPLDDDWCYRVYNFETYNEMNYFRKLISADTPGATLDTGWQEVATMDKVPDITDINTKLTQLETNQINKTTRVDMIPTPVCYKITPKDSNSFSKILVVDLYGGCVLITGSIIPDYKSFKAVRLSNGCWESYSASNNVANKIESVYYDGSYIYVNCLDYIKINFEGGFTNIEKIDSLPSNTTQIPILDLTQGNTTSGGNTNNDVYSTEEQAVGTWINGKTLYRRTIEDNTLRETGNDMIKLFAYNTNMKIVKYEGVVTLNTKTGQQTMIHSLPYYNSEYSDEVYVTKTTLDTLRLDSYLTNYRLGGYIVSVYYYKI